jgi:hypothetical protein
MSWLGFIRDKLLARRMISPSDLSLFKVTDSVREAVDEIRTFYQVYHSMRYVRDRLVLRLNRPPSESLLGRVRSEFRDILVDGTFDLTPALPAEANDEHVKDLPRLRFHFDRKGHGRLRELIDLLNREVE